MSTISRFSFPTTILYGEGAVKEIPACINELKAAKPLVITDPALVKTAAFQQLKSVLETASLPYEIFSGVHANPLDTDVHAALEVYMQCGCDLIIGIGGGSPLDTAKAAAVLAGNGGAPADYDVQQGGGERITAALPPIIGIPTTAGTGSEVGKCAVITSSQEHRKFLICHPNMVPARAVLDPQLTVSLPAHLTAATGMDALTHNVESLTAPVFHPLCDAIAVKGIELVVGYLERAVRHPDDLEARGYMLLAATMGAIAFQKDLGASHSLSHALSAVCGVQHGLANAICLPVVMKYNLDDAKQHYALIPPYFGINTFDMDARKAAEVAVEQIKQLNQRIGIPASLKEVGVKSEAFDEITEKAFLDPCHATNIKACTKDDLRALLESAWRGE
ncbi:MAG: iron-containing alcohol dehydrogenase [Spirochaetota bacterium]